MIGAPVSLGRRCDECRALLPDHMDGCPNYEWVEITQLCDAEPRYMAARCKHLNVTPVHDVTGELVANLCQTCDKQLPPTWSEREGIVQSLIGERESE